MVLAENISKNFNQIEALKGVSFQIRGAELFGFLGPDGAGKTTLFRIMTSLMLPSTGAIKVAGLDVIKEFRKVRNIAGYMPGKFSLYSDLSVEENLNFFASVFGTTFQENYDLIHDIYIQIKPFKNRMAGKLSGGMKQKLALSCALIHKPKILILDEPTTGVDAVSRKEFWELLKGLKDKGITIVVSTPYMDEAQQCDRVALIQDGKILSVDRPGDIIKNYDKTVYSVRADNIFQLLTDLRKLHSAKHVYAFGQTVHYTDENPDFQQSILLKYLLGKGHKNLKIDKINPEIEDVFIDLMQVF
jgi:ABC-type multidrug transport system ATPase subunit